MDKLIQALPGARQGDLMLCEPFGVAWQADMAAGRVDYDRDYLEKYRAYENTPIAQRIVAARLSLVRRHYRGPVLDVGVGSGQFLRECPVGSRGFDINPQAVAMLRVEGRYSEAFGDFEAHCFWDTIEHVEEPEHYFRNIKPGGYLFTSLPVFGDIRRVRESKHYRPGEHLYYWTVPGFVAWMALHGFRLLEQNSGETAAGREAIESFAFCKTLAVLHPVVSELPACHCGGEMQVCDFHHPRRSIEYFMRCRECLAMSPSASTEKEALALWRQYGAKPVPEAA